MELRGQVWFDFSEPAVWTFYRWVRALAERGTTVALDWQPLPRDGERLAASVQASLSDAADRGRFIHAMLGLVHLEGRSVDDEMTVTEACRVAGIPSPGAVDDDMIERLSVTAHALGVVGTPTLYRLGPPMRIHLTPAALIGDPRKSLAVILDAGTDDGIWELSKP